MARQISAEAILNKIKAGATDAELMAEFDLSHSQLDEVLDKLVERGLLTRDEVAVRRARRLGTLSIEDRPASRYEPGPSQYAQGGYPPGGAAYEGYGPLPPLSPEELRRLNRNAIIGFVGGILIPIALTAIAFLTEKNPNTSQTLPALVGFAHLLGTVFWIWGCVCVCKMKGYSGALGLLGLLGCVGAIIVAALPNKYKGKGGNAATTVIIFIAVGLGLVMILGIVLAIAIPYYVSYKRTACDRGAVADMKKLSASFERLGNELVDLNFKFDAATLDQFGKSNSIKYLVGPYYGWGGTSRKCEVLVRMKKDAADWVLESTALKGSRPGGAHSRYVYRQALVGGKDLPAKTDSISYAPSESSTDWNQYGGKGHNCYTGTIVDPKSRPLKFVIPKGVDCGELPD